MTLKLENYQTAIENLHEAVIISQCKGGNPIVFINESFTTLTGYTLEDIAEKPCEFLYKSPSAEEPNSVEVNTILDCMKQRDTVMVTIKSYKKDGTLFYAEVSLSQIKNHRGRTTHYISVIRDVSIRVALEKQLFDENDKLYQANQSLKLENKHDLLTGILNRSALNNEVKGLFLGAKRAKEYFTLFFLSIDEFSTLVETHGKEAADKVVQYFAQMLKNSLKRESDIVFRYAEEEFVICYTGQSADSSQQFAEKISSMASAAQVAISDTDDTTVSFFTNIGVVSAIPDKQEEINNYILAADIAMHKAKQSSSHVCFSSNL